MKKIITIYFLAFLFLSLGVKAQNVQNYAITAGLNESLQGGGGWTQLIGSNQIAASAVTPIGFETWFMGERFTQFSVNTNGVLRFGNVPIVFQGNTPGVPNNARICAFAGVGYTPSDDRLWRTETNGQVRYKIIGTAPNRTLVVDWLNIRMAGDAASSGISDFQIHVYETAPANTNGGLCKVIYGRMRAVAYNNSFSAITNQVQEFHNRTGIGYPDGIAADNQRYVLINTINHPSVAAVNLNYGLDHINQTATALPFNINLNSTNNTSRKFYNFNPPAPTQNVTFVSASCVSDNSLLMNWTAAVGNQVGYVIYRSTDGVNYTFRTQVNLPATTYLDTGLTAGITYYYRVLTVTEGKLSAVTANNQVFATTTTTAAVYSIISNNWSNILTWTTSLAPLVTQDVIIGCIVPHTVTVNTNGVANNLTVETGSILNFNAGQTITTEADVINNGTINLNGGTLIIKGNLINNAGATVNIGNGNLIVQGNFQNDATATLNGNTGLFRLAGNFTNAGAYTPNTSIMRFDGTAQQLINHTGTSSYNSSSIITVNTTAVLPLSVPSSGTGGGGGFGTSTTTTLANLTGYTAANIRVVNFTVPAGTYTGINNLVVDITHTYNDDLEIYLVAPNNTVYTVAADMGGSGDNYENTIFTMSAATTPPDGFASPITGSFRPIEDWTGYAGTYAGTWSLYIIDDAGGDSGQLNATTLTLNQSSTPPPAGLQFHTVQMQNTGAGVRTQNTDIIVNNTATWTTGVFRADNNHLLIFPDNATSTVAINASHADMLVRKIGDDAFDFPVGNAGWGAPIGISAPTDVTDHFTANYVKQVTPNDPFSKEATIHHVGQCEYWILDRTNGASNVVVTLSYDNIRSCTVGTETGLKVLRWDGAIWRDHFNGGLTAAPYTGVLSTGTVNNFSPFTLGATFDNNVLPLTFLSFDAKPLESDAILDWTTIGELNHDYFEIERSINEQDFQVIGSVQHPITGDNTKNTYSFVDKNVGIENREAYYRLKQIDTDGKFSYSDVKKVNWSINNSENKALFVAYPNPFTDILTLDFSLDKQENVEIILMDMAGRTIKTISQPFEKGNNKLELNNLQNLAQGSYLIQLKTNTVQKTFKVVKM